MLRTLALLVLLAACGGSGGSASDRPAPPPDQVTGVIIEMRYDGEQLVEFDLETVAETFAILIDPDHDYGFNLNHLRSHRDQQLPILVDLESRDGDLYAVNILDA